MWDYQFHEGKTLPLFPSHPAFPRVHSCSKFHTGVSSDYKCQLWHQTYQRMKAITWLHYSWAFFFPHTDKFLNVPGSQFPHLLNGFNRLTGSLWQLKTLIPDENSIKTSYYEHIDVSFLLPSRCDTCDIHARSGWSTRIKGLVFSKLPYLFNLGHSYPLPGEAKGNTINPGCGAVPDTAQHAGQLFAQEG